MKSQRVSKTYRIFESENLPYLFRVTYRISCRRKFVNNSLCKVIEEKRISDIIRAIKIRMIKNAP